MGKIRSAKRKLWNKTRKIIFNEKKKTKEICKTLDRISKEAEAGTPSLEELFVSGKLKITNKQMNYSTRFILKMKKFRNDNRENLFFDATHTIVPLPSSRNEFPRFLFRPPFRRNSYYQLCHSVSIWKLAVFPKKKKTTSCTKTYHHQLSLTDQLREEERRGKQPELVSGSILARKKNETRRLSLLYLFWLVFFLEQRKREY